MTLSDFICYYLSISLNYPLSILCNVFQEFERERRYPGNFKVNPEKRLYPTPDCPVCLQDIDGDDVVPHVIPACGHTVCQDCAQSLITVIGIIDCPVCRAWCRVKGASVENLPLNHCVMRLIKENKEEPGDVRPVVVNEKPLIGQETPKVSSEQPLWVTMILCIWYSVVLRFLIAVLLTKWHNRDNEEMKSRTYQSKGWECERCLLEFHPYNAIPRVMSCCGNTLCHLCCDKCTIFGITKCPFCLELHPRRLIRLERFPKNYLLIKMIEDSDIVT